MITDTFPEVFKSLKQEFSQNRMRTAALLAWLVGLSALLLSFSSTMGVSLTPNSEESALRFAKSFWWLITAVWGTYGCFEILNSLPREKAESTWDLQRITPLSSFRMAGGKLLGPLLFPTFVASLLLPFFVYSLAFAGGSGLSWATERVTQTFCFLFFGFSFSLLASCFLNSRRAVSLVLVSLLILSNVFGPDQASVNLFGFDLSRNGYLNLVAVIFGVWSFKGAQWILGGQLLEAPKFWRAPLFVLFIVTFGLGHQELNQGVLSVERGLFLGVGGAVVFSYLASLLETPSIEQLRKSLLFSTGLSRIHRLPLWVLTATALACSVWAALLFKANDAHVPHAVYAAVPLFVFRDFLIFQLITLVTDRRPQVTTLVLLGLLYLVPNYLIRKLSMNLPEAIFSPLAQGPLIWTLGAPLIEIGVIAVALNLTLKAKLKS